ncbi:mitochondrial translation [Halocaridina rubra]|uniref:Large ribosomal subunit protein mL52 n=1 Tax=Halocaridina rubra TaxID=373956 RepID=A0AAN8XBT8_HALRR
MASVLKIATKFQGLARFSTASSSYAKFKKSFETRIGAHGPLIDGPDYTFLDGRPTPLGAGQRRRAIGQVEASEKVIQLMKETKFAIERHQKREKEVKEKRQRIMKSKLKPKDSRRFEN